MGTADQVETLTNENFCKYLSLFQSWQNSAHLPIIELRAFFQKSERRIFSANVEPILTYASETSTMDLGVQAVGMDSWWRCVRVMRRDRNSGIKESNGCNGISQ